METKSKRELMILTGQEEICSVFNLGRRRLERWRERGLPVKVIDGRLTGHFDDIQNFIRIWLESSAK